MGDYRGTRTASFATKIPPRVQVESQVRNDEGLDHGFVQISCSWDGVVESPPSRRLEYALISVDMTIKWIASPDEHITVIDSEAVNDLLGYVNSSGLKSPKDSWSGRIILVTPTQGGYFARTKCFHQRFIGCSDLGIIQDRSLFGSRIEPAQSDDIESLLTSSVLAVIRSHSDDRLSGYDTCITEVDARMSFQWRVKDQPKERILAVVDGHLNLKSYLPFFNSAAALGVKFLLLDSETHWITHASHKGLYHHYIPIDMTPDETFHERIASAVKSYGPVDGICAIATYCLLPVAKAAAILGLPTAPAKSVASAINKYETRMLAGGAEPTAQVSSVTELDQILESKTFVPKYPLIVKPLSGTGSAHVFRADNSDELLKAVQWTCEGSKKKALIEAYVDGPELDVNFVLLDGELLFFEIADDYPSPGDDGTIDSDFWENTNVLPSTIPTQEYDIVRKSLHELLLKMGLKTGVFHLEARVQDSTMVYTEDSGIVDLRQKTTIPDPKTEPKCVLIEVNPRPPGMPCILSSAASYGVNMYDLHLLASLADHERYRSFSQPFDSHTGIPNHARAWSQLVWLRADKSGICASDDVCGEFLERLSPKDRTLITASMCFFERGQKIPPLKAGVVLFGAFFVVTSRTNRHDVLRVANIIQRDFKIPVEEDSESARLSKRGSEWSKVGFLHGAVDTFDPVHNPNGAVRLDNAENWFLHESLADFINKNNHFDQHLCAYGEGYTGTLRLRTAMAKHLNEYFRSITEVDPESITFTAGVTDLNEVCSMIFADPGDYILLGGLCYGVFNKDLCMRTGVKLEWANVGNTDQFSTDCVPAYEAAFDSATKSGKVIKALVICNPHNPLGQCYPPETLEQLIRFCASKKIHLISDEIYALSTYERQDRASEKFTSVLAIDYSKIIDPRQVHVLYGLSKDYGAAGMRLGCVISENEEFSKAVRAICRFSSPSQFSMDLAAKFLEDRSFMEQFLRESHRELLRSRLLVEDLLKKAEIKYHDKGNSGLFIWIDLSFYLPIDKTNGNPWAAERKLSAHFKQRGVHMDKGEEYCASKAGGFRVVFTVPEETLKEGIRRICSILSEYNSRWE